MEEEYKLKFVPFFNREVPIVLQNENGPCPLLAISNVLLLRNSIQLPLGRYTVGQERLISILAEYLLDNNQIKPEENHAADLQQNLQDVISNMHKLTTGLDVNPKFHSAKGFEFTHETAIFDLFDISLVHGWIMDPAEETATTVGDMSYNEVISKLISTLGEASLGEDLITLDDPPSVKCSLSVKDSIVHLDLLSLKAPPKDASSVDSEADEGTERWKTVRLWLKNNSSQLTWNGLFKLNQELRENEIAVFFRNNHFNTIFKKEKDLFLLITDQGYIAEGDLVWEKLESVNNDNEFYTGTFDKFKGSSRSINQNLDHDAQYALAVSTQQSYYEGYDISTSDQNQTDFVDLNSEGYQPSTDYDFALALRLQEEEQTRASEQYEGMYDNPRSYRNATLTMRSGRSSHHFHRDRETDSAVPLNQTEEQGSVEKIVGWFKKKLNLG